MAHIARSRRKANERRREAAAAKQGQTPKQNRKRDKRVRK